MAGYASGYLYIIYNGHNYYGEWPWYPSFAYYIYLHTQTDTQACTHINTHRHMHKMFTIIQFKILLQFHTRSKNQNYELCAILYVKLSAYIGDTEQHAKLHGYINHAILTTSHINLGSNSQHLRSHAHFNVR
jgi:hypothetical protein